MVCLYGMAHSMVAMDSEVKNSCLFKKSRKNKMICDLGKSSIAIRFGFICLITCAYSSFGTYNLQYTHIWNRIE